MKDVYEAYKALSSAYRKHLGLEGEYAVVFCDVIEKRLHDLEIGAEKKDASHLGAVLERIRLKQPQFARANWLVAMCEALVEAEGSGV